MYAGFKKTFYATSDHCKEKLTLMLEAIGAIGLKIEVFFLLPKVTEHGIYVKGTNNSGIPEEHSKNTFLSRFESI